MEELKTFIREKADDDYLTGLSNKGTVKRAYKDLAQEQPVLDWQDETAAVRLKEETCTIRLPLGESGCSCPSRSICRHVVTAILWLRQEFAQEAETAKTGNGEPQPEAGDGEPQSGAVDSSAGETVDETTGEEEPASAFAELLQYPPRRLKQICGSRRFARLLACTRTGEFPRAQESASTVTVELPWEGETVKLLEPLAYSTCTCHSRELCAHKAQALLIYQLQKGAYTLKDLEALQEEAKGRDSGQLRTACERIQRELEQQAGAGLSRQPPETVDGLLRLSVLSHQAGLAALENGLREAANEYRLYFARSAAFRDGELFGRLLSLYARAEALLRTEDEGSIQELAGHFRDTYEPAGTLFLHGAGVRSFTSRNGYEGEIYYFLEENQKRWYTWTDARPTFYEGNKRPPRGAASGSAVPWGLNCPKRELPSTSFILRDAKTAPGCRLSASQESKAEITGKSIFGQGALAEAVCWDYGELLEAYRRHRQTGTQDGERREYPVLVGAVRWDETSFDKVQQRFSWAVYDRLGRRLFLSLRYTKEEKLTISLLERLEQRLRGKTFSAGRSSILFFGTLYLEGGRLCLYPIEFSIQEKKEQEEESEAERREQKNRLSGDVLVSMRQYIDEAKRQLADLFLGGIHQGGEELSARMEELSKEGERMGLHAAARELMEIGGALRRKRHQMKFAVKPVLLSAGRLYRYLDACTEKIDADTALLNMNKED